MSIFGMPSHILICGGYDRYVLISVTIVKGQYLQSEVIGNPKRFIKACGLVGVMWKNDGASHEPRTCHHRRIGFLEMDYYSNMVTRTSKYLSSEKHAALPVYEMTTPNLVLPDQFYNVYMGNDKRREWHFLGSDFPLAPAAPRPSAAPSSSRPSAPPASSAPEPAPEQPQQIPRHIFKVFVEASIAKKEACPITLEKISMENVAMTPCGHLFDKTALQVSLRTRNTCPQCRARVTTGSVQTL
jgi:hypothetical protein